MRLDYHIDPGKRIRGIGSNYYYTTPTLTIALISKDDYSEIVIQLDELKEALDRVDE